MERIQIGMHVDIKRSDGRVHDTVVIEIKKNKKAVMVEWRERGETKGKEIDFEELISMNPITIGKASALSETLSHRQPAPPTTKRFNATFANNNLVLFGDLSDDENETIFPIAAPSRSNVGVDQYKWRSDSPKGSNKDLSLIEEEILPEVAKPWMRNGKVPPQAKAVPVLLNRTSRRSLVSPSDRQAIIRSTDSAIDDDVPMNAGSFDKKGPTVQEIERFQKQREERRAHQEKQKRQKEAEKAIDPGNPNYHFLVMIREYQNQIDYRPLKITDSVGDTRISVCVRKRPMSKKEINRKDIEVITIPNRDHLIVHQPQVKVDLTKYLENLKFRFDYTFDENVNNEMVYKFTAQPLVRTVFQQGFATCFAYGQTGSGKTHTMGGDFSGRAQDCSKGIYALTATDVFRLQRGEFRSLNLVVGCSFFEIYGGKVFDLLKNKNLLRVLEDGNKEVQVVGLQEEGVTAEQQVLDLIKRGTEVRTAGTTSANSNSSRSHAVFQIILRKNKKLWGKFSLIDLAGNERGQDTGFADRQTRMEGAEINKSLLALKECIRAMAKNSNHVPFRQSKLTMVLRDSFVGENARTCMIAMISPSMNSCEHTINTLRYADRVKELGCDDGNNASPMRDDELMIANPDEDVDLVLNSNGNSKGLKLEKVISALAQCEQKVINDQYNVIQESKRETSTLSGLLHTINDVDYVMEAYAKEWIKQLEQQLADRRSALENANKWLKVIRQEAEMSAKAKKK